MLNHEKQLPVIDLDFVVVERSDPIRIWLPACCGFFVAVFVEFCLIQGQKLVAKIDRLTHQRNKTSEAIHWNPQRAAAEATFTTSNSVRKNASKFRKRLFSLMDEN